MSRFTVQLVDNQFGRVVLDEVEAASVSAAETAALAAPPVSGPNGSAFNGAGNVVDQKQVLSVTGTDADGDEVLGPDELPVFSSIVDPFRGH